MMIKKLASFALALVTCLSLCVPAFASSKIPSEKEIQAEITAQEKIIFEDVYKQLKAQNALKFFDVYKNILRQDIEASVRTQYGKMSIAKTVSQYCRYGAVLSYYEPNSRCDVVITYLDYDNSYYYVLTGASFSCEDVVTDIFQGIVTSLISSLSPVLAISSYADKMANNSIRNADGYARVINVRDPMDGTHSSVVSGWSNHMYVSAPSGVQNVQLELLPYHDPWA